MYYSTTKEIYFGLLINVMVFPLLHVNAFLLRIMGQLWKNNR